MTLVDKKNPSGVSVHFEYSDSADGVKATVTTFNPVHETKFILEKATADNKAAALKMILEKIEATSGSNYTYSMEWSRKSDGKNQISHFSANDFEEVLDKFWHEKNKADYDIWLIRKNPVA